MLASCENAAMSNGFDFVRSAVSGAVWPGLPANPGALLLALQFQLEQTQWWPAEQLAAHQWEQLRIVLRHAAETVPFYRERLGAAGIDPAGCDDAAFRRLPLLTRSDVQSQGEALLSSRVPPEHGRVARGETSGSTGKPIRFYGTELSQLFWRAFTLRDHLWHQRDLSGTLAAIRIKVEDQRGRGWGPATDSAFETGWCATLDIRTDIDRQLSWLREQDPDYLITHPSTLRALVLRARELGFKPGRLRQVRTFAESLPADLRQLCREIWNVKLVDMYTCEEAGYIALQCPVHEQYHVQAESLIVEILDDRGNPCKEGEPGKVVITTLHNFAMPLVRYELGDYAEAGLACPCGRGLPVIKRIMGRARNVLMLPDGRRYFPSFPAEAWASIAPIRQLQVVQKSLTEIEVRLVIERVLTPDEEQRLTAAFQRTLGYPFTIRFAYVENIARSGGFKFEDFVSELAH
jgi:phenylacetate-CoA ligase